MIFSSTEFFLFLILLLCVLSLTGSEDRRRNFLLAGSYFFYGWWDWRFCFLILGSTIVDYFAALRIHETTQPRRAMCWLGLSFAANLGLLGFFKYFNFFISNIEPGLALAGVPAPRWDIILPVGISFYTFQTMSYTIDVYRKNLAPTRNFRDFALFVSFFPQLVAGPIVRGAEFIPQLAESHPLGWAKVRTGIEIFLKGFVKKVLFADTLAIYVDAAFAAPGSYSSCTVWLAVIAYAGQIYYDFSGYSDMAVGVGQMLGFRLPENFRHPYRSRNITEFWRRWHISLSSWLRDYLYIPLGGNRRGTGRLHLNILLTMLLGGLWHGAGWNFIVWGGIHGIALVLHKISLDVRGRSAEVVGSPFRQCVSWAATQGIVLLAWVFFRSPDFSTALIVLEKMLIPGASGAHWYYIPAMVILSAAVLLHLWSIWTDEKPIQLRLDTAWTWAGLITVIWVILLFAPENQNPFIYFRF